MKLILCLFVSLLIFNLVSCISILNNSLSVFYEPKELKKFRTGEERYNFVFFKFQFFGKLHYSHCFGSLIGFIKFIFWTLNFKRKV